MKAFWFNEDRKNVCGIKIKELRKQKKISTKKLEIMAQLAGYDTITQNAITKIELGIRFVPNYEVAIYLRCFLKQLPNIFYHLQQIQPINKQDAFYLLSCFWFI